MARGLDKRFLDKMREKLESGRQKGYVGWDEEWNCRWPTCEGGGGVRGELFKHLQQEVTELTVALSGDNKKNILEECADIANFAMFIADYHIALES